MHLSRAQVIWGLALILLGGLLLAQNVRLISASVPFFAWVFSGLGVVFLLTALTNRSMWGALFPGFVLLGLGAVIFLSEGTSAPGNVVGAIFLGSIALPFWIVALMRRPEWWPVIPAGVLTTLAGVALLSDTRLGGQVVGAIFFLGLGATFALVRLLTLNDRRVSWAWYPAVILAGLGVVVLATGDPQVWPWVLIAGGVLLLIRSLVPARRPPSM